MKHPRGLEQRIMPRAIGEDGPETPPVRKTGAKGVTPVEGRDWSICMTGENAKKIKLPITKRVQKVAGKKEVRRLVRRDQIGNRRHRGGNKNNREVRT